MNDILVSQSMVSKTRCVGTVSQTVRSGNGPYFARIRASLTSPLGDVPCPSSPSHGFLHHTIGTQNSAIYVHTITDMEM